MFDLAELKKAHALIGRHVKPTAQIHWPLLSQRLGAHARVKHENHNPTGAFKVRGGIVYLERLKRERAHVTGIISPTRGNHGQSLAFAGALYGVPVTIVVPRNNGEEKNAAMAAHGARLIEHGEDYEAARQEAHRLAAKDNGLEMVPSFHPDLVKGVATYALELFGAAPDLDVLYVPIGMGSGIVGCILARDLLGLKTEIVGAQAEGAPSYALSFEAGKPVSTERAVTNADGVATRVPDAEAVRLINRGAARIVRVSDEEIAGAIRAYWRDTHNLAEGAGAAALAAAMKEKVRIAGKKVGLVLSGGSIDAALFRSWVMP